MLFRSGIDDFESIMTSVHSQIHELQDEDIGICSDKLFTLCEEPVGIPSIQSSFRVELSPVPWLEFPEFISSYWIQIKELNRIWKMIQKSISRNILNPVKPFQETFIGFMITGTKWSYCISILHHLVVLCKNYTIVDPTNPTLGFIKNAVK